MLAQPSPNFLSPFHSPCGWREKRRHQSGAIIAKGKAICAKGCAEQPLDIGCQGEYAMRGKDGVADGTRTHDNRNHNPGLYQLSYSHHGKTVRIFGRACRASGMPDRNRTCNPQLRRLVLYPVELRAHSRVIPAAPPSLRLSLVGVERFELPTSCSQSRRATRLRYTPKGRDYTLITDKNQFLPLFPASCAAMLRCASTR